MNSDFKDLLRILAENQVESAWSNQTISEENNFPIHYLGKADLICAKQTAGRPQDLADLDELRSAN